jgi:hypothetical protein
MRDKAQIVPIFRLFHPIRVMPLASPACRV